MRRLPGRLRLAMMVSAAVLAGSLLSAPGQVEPAMPLPPELVAAWMKAGAKTGWMTTDDVSRGFREGMEGMKGELPAFRFFVCKDGVVGKLPHPQRAFGLDLAKTKVTDIGLKEVAALKSLQSLELGATQVTDAGLKELAGLKGLQSLSLGATKVTDVGLKELAALRNLQWLGLMGTKVTDAGVAELQKALPKLKIDR